MASGIKFSDPKDDFDRILNDLNIDEEELINIDETNSNLDLKSSEIKHTFSHAAPAVKERRSRYIERGTAGENVKKKTNYKCQICEALDLNPLDLKNQVESIMSRLTM